MKKILALTAIGVLVTPMFGCSNQIVPTAQGPMPAYCTQNNTAAGAVVGALLGPAIGAAAGGGRGAAIGAASGAALGGVTGAQADAQCHQIAMQNFMNMVAAQAAAQQAAVRAGAALPPPRNEYVDYVQPSTGQRNRITQTSSYTNPVTKETCAAYSTVSFDANNNGNVTGTGKVCTGADGKPHES